MNVVTIGNFSAAAIDSERNHRLRVWTIALLATALVIGVAAYGWDYYILGAADRAFSHKHALLKPSGSIGIKLGILGVVVFCGIFLYPIRKRIPWLAKQGSARHWLDFHVILGVTAPILIAFHSSFKFQGIAGMAFWIMSAVALSGVAGRYIYAQIPRRLNSAELSLKELDELQQELSQQLAHQQVISAEKLEPLFRLPNAAQVNRLPAILALLWMIGLDVMRPFRVARLRLRVLGWGGVVPTLGGLLPTKHTELEQVIRLAREKASLAKRILFLARAQQVFHLWHVVHRPFSYSFVVLAIIHITVVLLLGYM